MLILNADDWGRNAQTTDKTLDCVKCGAVSAVSAMVFMEDSERAATIARERKIETGLHLNFTTAFTAASCPAQVFERQRHLASYLLRSRLAQAVFHPGLIRSFDYVVRAQIDEYRRLYGADPQRLDGHHHMHLCENVLLQGLLPAGTLVRRNFSFYTGEKSIWNRLYRRFIDQRLARRHRLVDLFFSLEPLEPARLQRILSLSRQFAVEVETHPVNIEEHRLLTESRFFGSEYDIPAANGFTLCGSH
jgi:chitin disaccharide deacetylase